MKRLHENLKNNCTSI